jgi:hypothetical protein
MTHSVACFLLKSQPVQSLVFIAAAITGLGGTLDTNEAKVGAIEGQLMYPSCELPDDLQVCGEETSSGQKICTRPFVREDGIAYRLELPAGRYRVYSVSESARPGYRAYYSAFVTCGLRVECVDHAPLAVQVGPGQLIAHVDPADWFTPARAAQTLAQNF